MNALVTRRILQVATGVLLGAAVVSVFLVTTLPPQGTAEDLLADPMVPEPFPAPEFTLHSPDGTPFTHEDLKGEVSVVFFGFASCPDVCPITLATLSRALEALEDGEVGFQGIFVSVDPRRDTPEVLQSYMERYHPSLTALTGPESEVHRIAGDWGVHAAILEPGEAGSDPHAHHGSSHSESTPSDPADTRMHGDDPAHGEEGGTPEAHDPRAGLPFPEAPDAYHVEHSTRSLIVDRDGQVVGTLAPYLTADEVLETLQPLLSP